MLVYFITTLIVVILSYLSQYYEKTNIDDSMLKTEDIVHTVNTKFTFICATTILIAVAGLRYSVGADYWGYYLGQPIYVERIKKYIVELREPGYPLICYIVSLINNNPALSLFLASLITISLNL